jgi:endonuclease YncB( thermonuclease family)
MRRPGHRQFLPLLLMLVCLVLAALGKLPDFRRVNVRRSAPSADAPSAPPAELPLEQVEGRVRHVFDGDTLELVADGQPWRVRLIGIDAPEWHQPYGTAARDFLRQLCQDRQVRVDVVQRDRFERLLADVYLDDLWVNGQLVEAGFAWRWQYDRRRAELRDLEREARQAGRGLWADSHPVPPWDYRREHPDAAARR